MEAREGSRGLDDMEFRDTESVSETVIEAAPVAKAAMDSAAKPVPAPRAKKTAEWRKWFAENIMN